MGGNMHTHIGIPPSVGSLATNIQGRISPLATKMQPAKSSAAPKALTGTVSDSMCGAHHMEKDKSAAECTRECVKKGTKYALIVGEKVYTLDGHEAELDKLAGERATVKGSMMGEMVMVESVTAAKKAAK